MDRQDRPRSPADATRRHVQQPRQRQHHRLQEQPRRVRGPDVPEPAPARRPVLRSRPACPRACRSAPACASSRPSASMPRATRRRPTTRRTSRSTARGFFQVLMPDGTTSYTRDGSLPDRQGRPAGDLQRLPIQPPITIPQNATQHHGRPRRHRLGDPGRPARATVQVGQLQLATFINPAGLECAGENLYTETGASGTAEPANPGMNGAGILMQGYTEASNVNVVEEMVNMIADPARLRDQQQGDPDAPTRCCNTSTTTCRRVMPTLKSTRLSLAVALRRRAARRRAPSLQADGGRRFRPRRWPEERACAPGRRPAPSTRRVPTLTVRERHRAQRRRPRSPSVWRNTPAPKSRHHDADKASEAGAAPGRRSFGRPVTVNGTPILEASIGNESQFAGNGAGSRATNSTAPSPSPWRSASPTATCWCAARSTSPSTTGREFVRVQGIVRPSDIAPDNTVISYRVADAYISYGGQGTVANASKPGWLYRFFNFTEDAVLNGCNLMRRHLRLPAFEHLNLGAAIRALAAAAGRAAHMPSASRTSPPCKACGQPAHRLRPGRRASMAPAIRPARRRSRSRASRTCWSRFGVTIPANTNPQLKNVAAVTVSADLPAFSKPGQTIDITVSSIGNASIAARRQP